MLSSSDAPLVLHRADGGSDLATMAPGSSECRPGSSDYTLSVWI